MAANAIINGSIKEAEKSAEVFNKLVKGAMERFIDGVSDPTKDAGKKAVEQK